MTSTIKILNDKITTNLASVTDEKTIGQLAGAVTAASATTIDCVASTAALPAAANNTGRFVGVGTSSALCYRYSNGTEWKCDYTSSLVETRILWAWGNNSGGQLGTGNATNYSSPVTTAGGGTTWCQVSARHSQFYPTSTAIKTDGTLWTWGCNSVCQIGTGETTVCYRSPTIIAGSGYTWWKTSAGKDSQYAIKIDGTLWTWGLNTLGDGTTNSSNSPVTTAGGGTNWCTVGGGECFATAIKTDGTLWTWGTNEWGQLGTGDATNYSSPVTTIAGGTTWSKVSSGRGLYAIAIKTDGTLWTWGYNISCQLGTGDATNYSSPVTTAGGGTNWCYATTGSQHSIALKTDGTLWAWGRNDVGQLGTGDATNYSSPVTTAGGGTNWCTSSGGQSYSAAIKTDGTLWTWGAGGYGVLGTGNQTSRSSPVTTAGGGTNWCQVSGGGCQTLAITYTYNRGF